MQEFVTAFKVLYFIERIFLSNIDTLITCSQVRRVFQKMISTFCPKLKRKTKLIGVSVFGACYCNLI